MKIEFYTSPEGDIIYTAKDALHKILTESDVVIVNKILAVIRHRYPEAYSRLCENYEMSSRNIPYFNYRIVRRFIACNFGEYDQHSYDIDVCGDFNFEEVKCPLRGECRDEEVICKPSLDTKLTPREKEVLALIADGYTAKDIADKLVISIATAKRHRENLRVKLGVNSIAELATYYTKNFK